MRYLIKNIKKSHRGQMFILATMLISVYIVSMAAALINIGSQQLVIDREAIKEPYINTKNEIQNFIELILADFTKNGSTLTNELALSEIQDFLYRLRVVNFERGIISELSLNKNKFILIGNNYPYSNVSTNSVYSSQIYAEFNLRMSTIDSSLIIEESFSMTFIGQVDIQDNSIIIRQSRGEQFEITEAASIYILNGTIQLIPVSYPDRSGFYLFEGLFEWKFNVGLCERSNFVY